MGEMSRESPGDAPPQDRPAEIVEAPLRNRWAAGLLLAFCCWHAGFLLYSIRPGPAARDDPGHPAMDLYRMVLGGRQIWNMFDTIPILRSLDVRLVGENGTREGATAGPVLPGFTPYPHPESARYYNAFYRLLLANETMPFREPYLRKVRRIFPANPQAAAGTDWAVVVEQGYTRNIFHSRRGGPLSVLTTKTFELAAPDEEAP